jgi:sortase A
LRKRAIVLHGSSGQALAFGPGHVEGTPHPGERGTAVLSAHRDTHFAFLRHMQVGDLLHVTRRDGTALRFRASGASVVRWDASGIDPLAGPPKLLLSTCWPFNTKTPGPLRYLLEAELLQEPDGGQGG